MPKGFFYRGGKILADNFGPVLCIEIFPEVVARNAVAGFVSVDVAVKNAAVVFVASVAHFVQKFAHGRGATCFL